MTTQPVLKCLRRSRWNWSRPSSAICCCVRPLTVFPLAMRGIVLDLHCLHPICCCSTAELQAMASDSVYCLRDKRRLVESVLCFLSLLTTTTTPQCHPSLPWLKSSALASWLCSQPPETAINQSINENQWKLNSRLGLVSHNQLNYHSGAGGVGNGTGTWGGEGGGRGGGDGRKCPERLVAILLVKVDPSLTVERRVPLHKTITKTNTC